MTARPPQQPADTQSQDRAAASASFPLYVVIPGDLETRTGGYGYDRRIVAGLRARGWTVQVVRLDGSFPAPTAAARDEAARALAAIPAGALVLIDGLAFGALPVEAEREARRLTIVALVHHPLAAETGIDPALASELEISERRALAVCGSVVVTSRATAARLAAYGVTADRIAVVEPGTDPAPLARGSAIVGQPGLRSLTGDVSAGEARESASGVTAAAIGRPPSDVALLCVATLTPRKGYDILLTALAAIPQRNWRLTCAGSLDRDAATVARVRAMLRDHALEDRVTLAGDLEAGTLAAQYDQADLFVLPTRYEGYGMAVAEALARGLPVVSTATGAIAELVGEGGIVVAPGDVAAFASALSRMIADGGFRAQLAERARCIRDRLPTWDAAAAAMADVLQRESRRAEALRHV